MDQLFAEIERVLDPTRGVYCCITLAQDHIQEALLSFFGMWTVHVIPFPPVSGSKLCPFLFIARAPKAPGKPKLFSQLSLQTPRPRPRRVTDLREQFAGAAAAVLYAV